VPSFSPFGIFSPISAQSALLALLSTYNACYGFCLGSSMTSTGSWVSDPKNPAFSANLRGQSFQASFGQVQFDGWPAALQQFAIHTLPDENGPFALAFFGRSVAASTCEAFGCSEVQLEAAQGKSGEF
jgi:hypothetical protein